jgi:hypothetical protein
MVDNCVVCNSDEARSHVSANIGGEHHIEPVMCASCDINLYEDADPDQTCISCDRDAIFHHVKFVYRPSEGAEPMIDPGPGLYCLEHAPEEFREKFGL